MNGLSQLISNIFEFMTLILSVISLMISVDVKYHVYLLTYLL